MSDKVEELYLRLGALSTSMPSFADPYDVKNEELVWLGKASAAIQELAGEFDTLGFSDALSFNMACDRLSRPNEHARSVKEIRTVFFRALGRAETKAPAPMQGAFLGVGAEFDAIVSFSKVMKLATADIIMIDAYADETLLSDFVVLAPETVKVRILADGFDPKPSLNPAVERWLVQFPRRIIEARNSPARALHDRLIFLDGKAVYQVGQSVNHLAVRSPTSVNRVDPETAARKIQHYEAVWTASMPL